MLEVAEGLVGGGAVGEAEGDGVLVHGHVLPPWDSCAASVRQYVSKKSCESNRLRNLWVGLPHGCRRRLVSCPAPAPTAASGGRPECPRAGAVRTCRGVPVGPSCVRQPGSRRGVQIARDGVDAAADLVGTDEAVGFSLELVADRDRTATIAAFRRGARAGIKLLGGGPGADPGTDIRAAARLQLTEAAGTGRLSVLVAGSHPLREAAAAHRQIMTGRTTGRIVLVS
ncbi:zinc-binding dehydrogenase [Streptomyces sp. NPDC001714]|uniref:zinc-binding dehydrogenase n=1 Tax=Streptomyces sp. NPDC001714 TaxID=3364603 RepID=UPI0036ABE79A